MSPRLIQALRRGGVTAKLATSRWGVWRHPDRRFRQIGTFAGPEIDILRLYECLVRTVPCHNQVLKWQTPDAESLACIEDLLAADCNPKRGRACLDQLILSHHDSSTRWTLAQAARGFRRDARMRGSIPDEACQRLARIVAKLPKRDCRFLYELVQLRLTKTELATFNQLRPMAVEVESTDVLKRIAHLYV